MQNMAKAGSRWIYSRIIVPQVAQQQSLDLVTARFTGVVVIFVGKNQSLLPIRVTIHMSRTSYAPLASKDQDFQRIHPLRPLLATLQLGGMIIDSVEELLRKARKIGEIVRKAYGLRQPRGQTIIWPTNGMEKDEAGETGKEFLITSVRSWMRRQ